ncbi:MAG TPA: hypothetical protein VEO19_07885 [Terriglobia bacterium]|nr:hypothetical protein [Terriglobia bacterium]
MERVRFMTIGDDSDLVVSFAIPAEDPSDVKSLILLRTPKQERFLYPWEQGVNVSHDDFLDEDGEDFDILQSIELERGAVRITTRRRQYDLDIQNVDRDQIRRAAEILRRMNFDQSFGLKIGAI